MALTLTERAAEQVQRVIHEKQLPETTVLRVSVAGGGCSGFEYRVGFDRASGADDLVTESHGVRIAVDKRSARFVTGTEIDYLDDLLNSRFVFNNPLAVRTCGCGSSFQV